jgi:RNA polymerase sigma-70 factor (ECF subfamily)
VETSQPGTLALERRLVELIGGGDKRAFAALFEVYGPRIFRYAVRLIGDTGKAEEVTNDTMMEVWKSAARFEGRSSVSTWIIGIARHLALNSIRGKRLPTVAVEAAAEVADDDPGADAAHDYDALKRTLRSALGKLTPEHRDVIELTFFHGHSYEEIASIVGCPENTVKTRMFHAKKQLKSLLGARVAEAFSVGAAP